jgi:hypothetical protein
MFWLEMLTLLAVLRSCCQTVCCIAWMAIMKGLLVVTASLGSPCSLVVAFVVVNLVGDLAIDVLGILTVYFSLNYL